MKLIINSSEIEIEKVLSNLLVKIEQNNIKMKTILWIWVIISFFNKGTKSNDFHEIFFEYVLIFH